MTHIHTKIAGTDSKAGEVASILFSDEAKLFPETSKILVEFLLGGKVTVDAVRTALALAVEDMSANNPHFKQDARTVDCGADAWTDDLLPARKDH